MRPRPLLVALHQPAYPGRGGVFDLDYPIGSILRHREDRTWEAMTPLEALEYRRRIEEALREKHELLVRVD